MEVRRLHTLTRETSFYTFLVTKYRFVIPSVSIMQAIRDSDTEKNALYEVLNDKVCLCVVRIEGIFFTSLAFENRQKIVDFAINIEQHEQQFEPLQNLQRNGLYNWL